jgi:hypothetical protein
VVRPEAGHLQIGGGVHIEERIPRGERKINPSHHDHFNEMTPVAWTEARQAVTQRDTGIPWANRNNGMDPVPRDQAARRSGREDGTADQS